MTEARNAGESRGGEGSAGGATTSSIARAVLDDALAAGYEPDVIKVQYVTVGLYACEVLERGSNEPERFMVSLGDDA